MFDGHMMVAYVSGSRKRDVPVVTMTDNPHTGQARWLLGWWCRNRNANPDTAGEVTRPHEVYKIGRDISWDDAQAFAAQVKRHKEFAAILDVDDFDTPERVLHEAIGV